MGFVAGSSMREAIRKVLELWKATDPDEVQRWLKHVKDKRASLRDAKGFTQTRELMQVASLPQFVHLWMCRLTGDGDWLKNDPGLFAIVLDELPEAKINESTGTRCAADHA
jgi:hypothetical protein